MTPTDDDSKEGPPAEDSGEGSFFLEGFTVSPQDAERPAEPLPEPTDEFEFLRELGRGGMGVVYEAVERKSGRHIALKVISKRLELSEDAIKRFEREGRAAASISHDNCVFVYGAHIVHRSPAISMELMDGETLEDRIQRTGPPDPETAVSWIVDVLDGIEAAHEAGVIHRDIKPSNVFIDATGKVKVGDFGLSRTLDTDQKLTMTGAFLGSPMYASPEQVRGKPLDHRTDIYSIGATLYTVLTGDAPFRANTVGDLFAQVATETPSPPSALRPMLPHGLDRVVAKAMARDPGRRFADCGAFRRALAPFLPGASTPAGLGFRFLAYGIDVTCVIILSAGTKIARLQLLGDGFGGHIDMNQREPEFLGVAVLYFTLLDGLLGRTIGKMVFGLRVTHARRHHRPGAARAFVRTVVFIIDGVVEYADAAIDAIRLSGWITAPLGLAPFVSMRRRNGFRGLHEFASGTRVIESRPPFARRLSGTSLLDPRRRESTRPLWTRGELQILGVIGSTPSGTLVHARDPRLSRDVLVHEVPSAARRLPEQERSRVDATRLRWLDAGEDAAGAWDVYESPGGAALVEYRDANRGLEWTHARTALMSLGRLLTDDSDSVTVGRLWVDRKGRLRVLDFGVAEEEAGPEHVRDVLAGAARILFGVADDPSAPLPEDIPEEAENLVRRIVEGGLPDAELARLHHDLEDTAVEANEVPRRLRVVGLVMQSLGTAIVVGTGASILRGGDGAASWREIWSFLNFAFGAQLVLAVVGAWLTRSSPVFMMLRIRVVTRFGRRASRSRCATRAMLTWGPGLALAVAGLGLEEVMPNDLLEQTVAVAAALIYGGGAAFSIVDPERSLQDRLAGTRLVH